MWEYFHRVDADYRTQKPTRDSVLHSTSSKALEVSRARGRQVLSVLYRAWRPDQPHAPASRTSWNDTDLIDQFNFGQVKVAVIVAFRRITCRTSRAQGSDSFHRLLPMNRRMRSSLTGGDLVDDVAARHPAGVEEPSRRRPDRVRWIEVDPAAQRGVTDSISSARTPPRLRASPPRFWRGRSRILVGFYERSMQDLDPGVRAFVEGSCSPERGLQDSRGTLRSICGRPETADSPGGAASTAVALACGAWS
jgi:hypothetical protein